MHSIFNTQASGTSYGSLIKAAPIARHFFVNSNGGGSTTSGGLTPESAFTTLASACSTSTNSLLTASRGDVIHVLPGHAETYTGATTVCAVAGVRIIGYGYGRTRPTFTFTTNAAASFDITAASVWLGGPAPGEGGFVFLNAVDSQTAILNVTAADVRISDCEFRMTDLEASSTTQAVQGILATDAADRLTVERCNFHGEPATGTTSCISYGACDNVLIRGNLISGNHTTAGSIANTAAAVGGQIIDNTIVNQTADAQNNCIVLHSSTNSMISNNRLAALDSSSPIPIVAAAGFISGNYITGAVGVTASVLK